MYYPARGDDALRFHSKAFSDDRNIKTQPSDKTQDPINELPDFEATFTTLPHL